MWSGNDAAREKFGYPVFLEDLGLTDETLQLGKLIVKRIQNEEAIKSLGYEVEPYVRFDDDANEFLSRVREELGADFEILDER